MGVLVLKFGGTSVATIPAIENVAHKIMREIENGHQLAVIVSAMAGVTNQLVQYCKDIHMDVDPREYDAIVSSGEQVTSGLLALALQKRGLKARSWQGWQLPIKTSNAHSKARIQGIDIDILKQSLAQNEIAVIAGFQGISGDGRIATLGRGGSDTSAVAIAAALNADRCDIYTDVDGVYTADPRVVKSAQKIKYIGYNDMLEMASIGAKVLQTRSVELAMKEKIPVQVLSSFDEHIGSDLPGTVVVNEESIVEKEVIRGVTHSRDEAKITLRHLSDTPGIAANVFGPLAAAEINVDMIVQNIAADTKTTDLTFTVPRADLREAVRVLEGVIKPMTGAKLEFGENVAKVSIVGIGMRSYADVAARMFKTLSDVGVNIQVISTSEIKISVLIDEKFTEDVVRALHTEYGLDGDKVSS